MISITKTNLTSAVVCLRMCRNDDPALDQMKGLLSKQIHQPHFTEGSGALSICFLANILLTMGEYKKAHQMLNMISTNEDSLIDGLRQSLSCELETQGNLSSSTGFSTFIEQYLNSLKKRKDIQNNSATPNCILSKMQGCADFMETYYRRYFVGKDELSDQQRQSFEDYFQSLYSHNSSTASSNHPTLIQIIQSTTLLLAVLLPHLC